MAENRQHSIQTQHDNMQRYTNEAGGSHGNYHSALLLVFLLGSCGAALAFVPVLISSSYQSASFSAHLKIFTLPMSGLFALAISVSSAILIFKRKAFVRSGKVILLRQNLRPIDDHSAEAEQRHSLSNDSDHGLLISQSKPSKFYKNSPVFQIVLFGIGGGIYLGIGLVEVAYCRRVGHLDTPMTFTEAAHTIDDAIYLVALVTQVIFFIMYDGAIFHNCALFHYALAWMIADKVWVWLTLTLENVQEIIPPHNDPEHLETYVHAQNSSTLHIILETSKSFLEPFFVEFLTICIGVLFQLWNSIGKGIDMRSESEEIMHPDIRNYSSIVNEEHRLRLSSGSISDETESVRDLLNSDESDNADNSTRNSTDKLLTGWFTVFLITIAVAYIISNQILYIGDLEFLAENLSESTRSYIFYGIRIAIYGPLTLVSAISTYKIYQNNTRPPAPLSSSDILLVFTMAATFLWFLFHLIAATSVLNSNNEDGRSQALFALCFTVICIIHVWVQTQFLLGAHSVHRLGGSNSKLTKLSLMYLIAINASEWLQMALNREKCIRGESNFPPIMNNVFGPLTTRFVIFLLFPLQIVYRFHSAVMAYEILI